MIDAVIFDLDGVLLDSEQLWDQARRHVVESHGGRWPVGATADMQGMSSTEWVAYLAQHTGVEMGEGEIMAAVLDRLLASYRDRLPVIPGALAAVRRMAEHWPLGLASSSNRPVIAEVLELTGLAEVFVATVSSEEVARGKPAPDVYREAAGRLGVPAPQCAAVEDSGSGIRSARSARMCVVALPNPHFPPPPELLARVDLVLGGLDELTPDALLAADERRAGGAGFLAPGGQ